MQRMKYGAAESLPLIYAGDNLGDKCRGKNSLFNKLSLSFFPGGSWSPFFFSPAVAAKLRPFRLMK
jgi:hypothetical protein